MISKISSTCLGQSFAPLQERKTEIFYSIWYRVMFLHTIHVVPRCRSPKPCLPHQQDTIPYAVKISVLRSWRWAKDCPKHVELILEINKLLLLHLVGFFNITLPTLELCPIYISVVNVQSSAECCDIYVVSSYFL